MPTRASRRCSASDCGSQTATVAGDVCAPFAHALQSDFAAREHALFGVGFAVVVRGLPLKFRCQRKRRKRLRLSSRPDPNCPAYAQALLAVYVPTIDCGIDRARGAGDLAGCVSVEAPDGGEWFHLCASLTPADDSARRRT
jgi:hypothetical protein